jgi:serine/threonine protein kinase
VLSPKTAIRLHDELERELKVYAEPAVLEQWCLVLGVRLNRKGFHELFRPTRKLGKGNFATVYEAERVADKAKFAVKAFLKQNCFSSRHGREGLIN